MRFNYKDNCFQYMKIPSYILILVMAWWLSSCSTPTNVAYFQDAEYIRGMALQTEQPLRLRPKDKINILVNSADPMLVTQFNLTASTNTMRSLGTNTTPQTVVGGSSSGNAQILAYTVDEQGDIDFPVLGKVAVRGKTRQEVAVYLRNRLIERDLIKDPIVTVEYVNLAVNVLGEVNRPGRIDIQKDYFTILDAITFAGDLTINGQRENVMVFREVEGEDQSFTINLCDRQNMLSSPAYYLQQNDVVYVTPNPKRRREANSTGNTLSQPSLWISLASLLTTMGALLLK
jgi:polysaccharide export outer membrane protein